MLEFAGGFTNHKLDIARFTEHAEVVQIVFDPLRTTFGEILRIFFAVAHDPTQVNRQGNDRGTQYRSAIFVATRLEPLEAFFQAEGYHQNYAALNPGQGYIQAVAQPKVDKLRAYFGDRLRG